MKTRMKIFQPKTKPVFLPKIRWRPKKKGFHSNLVRFLAKKKSSPTASVLKPSAQVTKGGGMPQFCILFYANYTILATERGEAMAQWPPPKYAPETNHVKKKDILHKSVGLWFHIIIWCHSKWCHPEMVTPGAGRPPPLAMPLVCSCN